MVPFCKRGVECALTEAGRVEEPGTTLGWETVDAGGGGGGGRSSGRVKRLSFFLGVGVEEKVTEEDFFSLGSFV